MHLDLFQRRAMFYKAEEVLHGYFERGEVKFLGDFLLKNERWIRQNGPSYTDGLEHLNRLLKALTNHKVGELDGDTIFAFMSARKEVLEMSQMPEEAWPSWYTRGLPRERMHA